jgi:tetratricopeptide (TPR) repeat protein
MPTEDNHREDSGSREGRSRGNGEGSRSRSARPYPGKSKKSTHAPSKLGGARIGDTRDPGKPSRSSRGGGGGSRHPKREVGESSRRPDGGREREPGKEGKRRRESVGDGGSKERSSRPASPSRQGSKLVRLLSFTGYTYNRMTKKDRLLQFRLYCLGAIPLFLLAFGAHFASLGSGRLWLDLALLASDSPINSGDGFLGVWGSVVEGEFAARSWLIMWLEHFRWGVEGSGYHIRNLTFHALNALLVWRLARNLGVKAPAQWFAAAIFAVHPLCFPAVGWIYARSLIVATTFSLASLHAFTHYDSDDDEDMPLGCILRASGWAFLAAFCHAGLALALPFVAMGFAIAPFTRTLAKGGGRIIGSLFLLVAVLPGASLSAWLGTQETELGEAALGWVGQLREGGWLVLRGGWKTVWPHVPFLESPQGGGTLVSLIPLAVALALAALLLSAAWLRPLRPVFAVVWPTVLGVLGVLVIFPHAGTFRHGVVGWHVLYPAAIPILIGLASLVALPFRTLGEKAPMYANLASAAVVALFLAATVSQASIFASRERLWAEVADACPDVLVGHENLARVLIRQDRLTDAVPHLRRAWKIAPDNYEIRKLLGQVLLELGEAEEARKHLVAAFENNPEMRENKLEEELQQQLEAIGNNPDGLPEFLNISALPGHGTSDMLEHDELAFTTDESALGGRIREAYLATQQGDMKTASELTGHLLQEDPRGPMGNYLAGYIAYESGRHEQAARHLAVALESKPDLVGALYLLGVSSAETGRNQRASATLLTLLRLEPKMAPVYYELGRISEAVGQPRQAVEFYSRAILHKQNYVDALRDCADLLATHPSEAVRNGRKALQMAQKAIMHATEEDDPRLLLTLSAAYAEAGFMEDAVEAAKEAADMAANGELREDAASRLQAFERNEPFRRTPL